MTTYPQKMNGIMQPTFITYEPKEKLRDFYLAFYREKLVKDGWTQEIRTTVSNEIIDWKKGRDKNGNREVISVRMPKNAANSGAYFTFSVSYYCIASNEEPDISCESFGQ